MEEKKVVCSWTMSDGLWEEVKEYISKKQRDPKKYYQKAPGQGRPSLPARQVLGASSMFYGLDANGKQFHENMGTAAVFTGIFKNDRWQIF